MCKEIYCILNSECNNILSFDNTYKGHYMESWMTKHLFCFSLKMFSFIFYSGMDDRRSSHYIWKDSRIVVCYCQTKHQFQRTQCSLMVRWQRLFNPCIHWWYSWSQKICRNSDTVRTYIGINSSDIHIWWKGCECGLFVFNWGLWEQNNIVLSTRQVWMLV